jgi:uncharacterized protein YdeI (YjbR/CyaY-like superfamily)
MEITETFHAATRAEWRAWLAEHHADRDEIWLVSYRKKTGVPGVAYADAVEEGLCFGWIDSIRKTLDEERYAQRWTPRRPGSGFSQTNRERLAVLLAEGRVHPAVAAELDAGSEGVDPASFEIPAYIEAALNADPDAWAHWQSFTPAYRRIRAAYVDHARDRGAEFGRRLDHLVRKTAAGQTFGYGIERFY